MLGGLGDCSVFRKTLKDTLLYWSSKGGWPGILEKNKPAITTKVKRMNKLSAQHWDYITLTWHTFKKAFVFFVFLNTSSSYGATCSYWHRRGSGGLCCSSSLVKSLWRFCDFLPWLWGLIGTHCNSYKSMLKTAAALCKTTSFSVLQIKSLKSLLTCKVNAISRQGLTV